MGMVLKLKGMFQHADDVWTVLAYPSAVVLADHVAVGVAHLFSDPADRSHPAAEQLTCIGVSALTRPAIPDASMLQVSLEKAIADCEVADMRQATGSVQKYEMQLVLPECAVIPLHHFHGLRFRAFGHCLQFAEGIECWSK